MKRSPLDRHAAARRYEDRLRAEGHHKYRRIGRNRERSRREHERAYGDKATWLRTLPSVASNRFPTVCSHVNPRDREELPHGMGRKHDSRWTVPLTLEEEREMHRIGQDTFEAKHSLDLTAEAEHYHAAWQERAREVG